jgi:hypothetical protein
LRLRSGMRLAGLVWGSIESSRVGQVPRLCASKDSQIRSAHKACCPTEPREIDARSRQVPIAEQGGGPAGDVVQRWCAAVKLRTSEFESYNGG